MTRYLNLFYFISFALPVFFFSTKLTAQETFSINECTTLKQTEQVELESVYTEAILWEVKKPGQKTSYILGTIHVKDPRVLDVPLPVIHALKNSEHFVMESITNPKSDIILSQKMFSAHENSILSTFDKTLGYKTIEILSRHNVPAEYVRSIQPWAAYLMMNYPPGNGIFLDIKLMELAEQNRLSVSGLETMEEQISIFAELRTDEQFQLLVDTICNYEQIQQDLKRMIELYLQKDITTLTSYGNLYNLKNQKLYQKLSDQLINKRNRQMTTRLIPILEQKATFVAVGILHLTGEDGILSLLKHSDYTITPIY